uniref:Helitron helicase-like domain-containing protein n=1 Tax=Strigamia maritima TaxID=126957 RepID=T1IYP9_STRMM
MNIECPHCGALRFKGEILSSRCCHKGKVKLPPLKKYPEPLKDLLLGSDKRSRDLRTHIRQYNSLLSFASMIATVPALPPSSSGKAPYCYRIHRAVYHEASALHDETDENPSFAQLYMQHIYHTMREVEERERELAKKERNRPMRRVHMVIEVNKSGNDKRRYNDATETDIAAVFVGDDGNVPCANDQGILVYPTHKKGQPTRIWNNSEHKIPCAMCYYFLMAIVDGPLEGNMNHHTKLKY